MMSEIQLIGSLGTNLYTLKACEGTILNDYGDKGTIIEAFRSLGINVEDLNKKDQNWTKK